MACLLGTDVQAGWRIAAGLLTSALGVPLRRLSAGLRSGTHSVTDAHPRDLEKVRVDALLKGLDARLLAEVVRPQQGEVVVRVDVVQRQDQVDQRLAAAPQ